jgi:hypothetical protein
MICLFFVVFIFLNTLLLLTCPSSCAILFNSMDSLTLRFADLRASSSHFDSSSHLPNASTLSVSLLPGGNATARPRRFSSAQKKSNVYLDSQGFQSDYFEILNTTDAKCKEIIVFIPGACDVK